MKWLGTIVKYSISMALLVGLVFAGGFMSVLLYGKMSNKPWADSLSLLAFAEGRRFEGRLEEPIPTENPVLSEPGEDEGEPVEPEPLPPSVILDAPAISQFPELTSGCEVTSLTMLLQYYGINKDKLELAKEMKKDPTPLQVDEKGNIVYWGNPNLGFVGEVTGKGKGFGIYHTALYELLEAYVPTAVDLTGSDFETLERQVAKGIPVVVWTTINMQMPPESRWVVWDTPIGPIKTTFLEHAVLLVGYDEDHVYVNDPWTGKAKVKVDKAQFIETYKALGKQALSYEPEEG